jgi:hypothetical protein
MGFSWIQILWDLEKFYDHVRLDAVVDIASRVDYPLMPLFLALDMHRAPRRLRASGAVSDIITPGRSLLAGCSQSVDIAKLALWDILETAHANFRPLVLESWVDDLSQRHVGKAEVISPQAARASEGLGQLLRDSGFVILYHARVGSLPTFAIFPR